MGHQIYADGQGNHDLGVCFTDGAWQVVHWCEKFAPRVKPDGMSDWQWADQLMGSSEATPDAVRLADDMVPTDYAEAKTSALVDDRISEDEFTQCREFLSECAKRGVGFSGSY